MMAMLGACASALDNADYIPGPSSGETPDVTDPDVIAENQIKVISFNIRTANGDKNTGNAWNIRKKAIPPMFKKENPTVFGVQEALSEQVNFLNTELPEYAYVGVGRDDGKEKGEFMSIFYKKSDASLVDWGTFWLSQTPDIPSKGWDAAYNRTATWAIFKHEPTGKRFIYVNTHLDNAGKLARQNGLLLIRDKILEMNKEGLPVILTADFNSSTDNAIFDCVKAVMQDARKTCPSTDNHASFNGWGQSSSVIDHIFYYGFSGIRFRTVTESYEGVQYMSDHYPVSAILEFPEK